MNIFFPKVSDQYLIPNDKYENQEYTFILSSIRSLNLKADNIFHNNKFLKNLNFKVLIMNLDILLML